MSRMYIGPTLPGVVEKNRIFKDQLPEKVENLVKESKNFARLLIPIEDVIKARQDLQDKNSVIAVSYQKIKESLEEGE